jgi:hypothetical protein
LASGVKATVVVDEVAAGFTGIFDALQPVAVVQDFFLSAGQDLPQLDFPDIHATSEVHPVRRKGDADGPIMIVLFLAEKGHELGACGDFPDLDVFIVAAARQHEAVGGEGEADDIVVVACEEKLFRFAGRRVP